MSPHAGRVYERNFTEARFYEGRLETIDPRRVARQVGPVDLLLASPECTNHSPAKGAAPRCERSRKTAFQVVRFAEAWKPRWVIIENVVNMRNWKRFPDFTAALEGLGYRITKQILDAADFGVPQTRRRLFILCDRHRDPGVVKPNRSPRRAAASVIDGNGTYSYSPLRTERRAAATIERAERAMAALGRREPFLLVYYGSDQAGGWQRLERTLRTVTTLDRFAFVRPTSKGHVMRMLQVPELKEAMGMPKRFQIEQGTRRERIRLVGNAVCPPVMRAAVRTLIGATDQ